MEKTETFKCDICGHWQQDRRSYSVVDENCNIQEGLKQCLECLMAEVGEEPPLKSQRFHALAELEDNDFKVMKYMNKSLRETRMERFEKEWLGQLRQKVGTVLYNRLNDKFEFHDKELGRMFYFPKANTVHITATNTWKKPGLSFLVGHFKLERLEKRE